MLFIDASPNEIDDRDVVPQLAARAEAVTKHETQRGLEHCFVRLLQRGFLIKNKNLAGRNEFSLGALQEAFNLRPVYSL